MTAQESNDKLLGVVHAVAMRIKHSVCPKCGSKNITIVWKCEDPDAVSYECPDCKEVTRESAT